MYETLGCFRDLVLAVSLAMGLAATFAATLPMTATTHHHVVAPGALTAPLTMGLTMGFTATLAAALTATAHHHRVVVVVVAPGRAAASLAGLALRTARLAIRLAGRLTRCAASLAATPHHIHRLVQFSIIGHLVYQGERKNAPHLRQN